MVQTILTERIVDDVRAAQQSCLLIQAFGGKPEWPSLDERLEAFEALLVSVPPKIDAAELELREALGLRRPHG